MKKTPFHLHKTRRSIRHKVKDANKKSDTSRSVVIKRTANDWEELVKQARANNDDE